MKLFLKIFALLALFAFPSGAEAANRFAVCSTTCTWDNSSTAMWSATTGGATGASVPSSTDAAIFDGATCVGGTTCTTTVAATINASNTLLSITMGACTASTSGCVLDFSANNPSITLTSTITGFGITGAGTRTLNCGTGTFTFSANGAFDNTTSGGSTISCASATFVMNSTSAGSVQVFAGGTSKSYGTLTVNSRTNGTEVSITATTGITFGTVNINGPVRVQIPTVTTTITAALTITGTSTGLVEFGSSNANPGTPALLTLTGASISAAWAAIKNTTVTGGPITGTAIFDIGGNSGVTGSAPPSGGGGSRCIGC